MATQKRHIDYESKIKAHQKKIEVEKKIIAELEEKQREQDILEITAMARSAGLSISECSEKLRQMLTAQENDN